MQLNFNKVKLFYMELLANSAREIIAGNVCHVPAGNLK